MGLLKSKRYLVAHSLGHGVLKKLHQPQTSSARLQ
jgi:hypothetical protein